MLRSSFCHLRDIPSEQAHSVDECKFDQGGYFIVKGNERALVGQEFIAQNTIIVEKDAKAEEAYIATVRSFKRGCGYRTRDIKLRMEVKSGKEGVRASIVSRTCALFECSLKVETDNNWCRDTKRAGQHPSRDRDACSWPDERQNYRGALLL